MERRTFAVAAAGTVTSLAGCSTGLLSSPDISITSVDHPSSVEFDEEFEVSATIENDGGEADGKLLVFTFGDDMIDNPSFDVEAGESVTRSATIDAAEYDPGERELTVRFTEDEDPIDRSITIGEPDPAKFEIEDVSVPDRVERGGSTFVDVTVANQGEQIGEADVTLSLDGEGVDTEVQQIHPGSTGEIRLSVRGKEYDPGDRQVGVSVGDDEVERSTTVEWPNPWGTEYVEVAATEEARMDHDVDDVVQEALQFWERNLDEYTGHQLTFDYQRNASDPDIQIRFTNDTSMCGSSNVSGCAHYNPYDAPDLTEVIVQPEHEVEGNHVEYPKEYLVSILMHELGHTIGLNHDDEPVEVMSQDADERDYEYRG